MTCAQVRERLRAEGFGKATGAHLERCPRCRQWWEAEQASERDLAAALRSVPAPPSLLGRVLAAVEHPPVQPMADLGDRFLIEATEAGLTAIHVVPEGTLLTAVTGPGRRWAERAAAELREYLAGERAFFDVPWDLRTLLPFSRRVLEVTARIPFGDVRTYAEIARAIGARRSRGPSARRGRAEPSATRSAPTRSPWSSPATG